MAHHTHLINSGYQISTNQYVADLISSIKYTNNYENLRLTQMPIKTNIGLSVLQNDLKLTVVYIKIKYTIIILLNHEFYQTQYSTP